MVGSTPDRFGANAWLVDEMYDLYRSDPEALSQEWRDFFEGFSPRGANLSRPRPEPDGSTRPATGAAPDELAELSDSGDGSESIEPLRGSAARLAANMQASLGVPTATSFRVVPARLLEVNRRILNNQLERTSAAGKVSFTHLIGYAVIEALRAVRAMTSSYVGAATAHGDQAGGAAVVRHAHVGLGLAVDTLRPDGGHALLVPVIKNADTLDFRSFWNAYEETVRKVRTGRVVADDLRGATLTLTNPGTLGTVGSVPRLMPGQGVIVGVGSIDFPAEWQAADRRVLAQLGISKVVTLSSTYDHRIIQGAESGLFLQRVHELLVGGEGFYERVFRSMGVPYQPVRLAADHSAAFDQPAQVHKQTQVDAVINMYRVRGHLMAHLDPLDWKEPQLHPELDTETYGLTLWDLDREFLAGGLAGHQTMTLGDILGVLRDAYCATVGVEYMHIQEPAQKRWIQAHVEGADLTLSPGEHRWILNRLNAAEALEKFLNTKYIGQKRFGLEGAESAIPLLDAVLDDAASAGQEQVVIGMAHRGRLNVLINIVGKSYGELFSEFEGNLDPATVHGSGDVKYHKGFKGSFTGRSGNSIEVLVASNPSHLEAVDPVVEGMARALCDRRGATQPHEGRPVLPLLIHGDAAFAGQGVVAETLNMSALEAYETGGTVHLVINNQLGFTTNPQSARSSVYATDVAKMVQAPIFHVNADDPEACVRVGRLAFAFRQAFHKDVVIDMVGYRRYGHNEQDDPSLTQPLLYELIKDHRSVRKLYTELLVRRGDITLEEAEGALADFGKRLQHALDETRAAAPHQPLTLPEHVEVEDSPWGTVSYPASLPVLQSVVDVLHNLPEGFNLHPKLAKVFTTRAKLWAEGEVDWALGEALAYGTLLLEGHDVRLVGQDTRRGTFGHRNAALVDYHDGGEYIPLQHLGEGGSFYIYDSLLSEYAALGFEYGYSLLQRSALVAWEAQFGDFVNGAQVVVDQFLAAAEVKWDQPSGLTLLLPHGDEGQGPEHSSARPERFLELAAGRNLRVADVTTAGQLFHLLRHQVLGRPERPLIVFTPKRYLRAKEARSRVEDLTGGRFWEVLDDGEAGDRAAVRRVVLSTGKAALDLLGARSAAERDDVAVVRIEQLYPWPAASLAEVLEGYPAATSVVWYQEEPENMGAWRFVHERLRSGFSLERVSPPASGAPAAGSAALHELEQAALLQRALGAA